MLLAIPFQGIASAAMLSCAHAATQQNGARAALVAALPGAHAAQHGQSAGHCDEAAAPAQAGGPGAQSGDHPDHLAPDHEHDGRCSACAACCMAAAMAPAPVHPPGPQDLRAAAVHAATDRLSAVDLALPERPPRFPLA